MSFDLVKTPHPLYSKTNGKDCQGPEIWNVYFDDIIYLPDINIYITHLQEVSADINYDGLRLEPKNYIFATQKAVYLVQQDHG